MRHGDNDTCRTCQGLGGVFVTRADVKPDTPREVVKAIADAEGGQATITCPACGGTGRHSDQAA